MKLIFFDLDGTLSESKQPISTEISYLLSRLLNTTKVAIISGGALTQFIKQVVDKLPIGTILTNLYLLPTSGAALYEYNNDNWNKIYEERLSEKEADTIRNAIHLAVNNLGTINFSDTSWGERIEYRGSQVTFSALGQQAPIALKKAWDPDHAKRLLLRDAIAELLPRYSVGVGGVTSIDITKKGIDKAYGVRKLCERLGIKESNAFYIGDELEKGGNDEVVYKTSIKTKSVANPSETAKIIRSFISNK